MPWIVKAKMSPGFAKMSPGEQLTLTEYHGARVSQGERGAVGREAWNWLWKQRLGKAGLRLGQVESAAGMPLEYPLSFACCCSCSPINLLLLYEAGPEGLTAASRASQLLHSKGSLVFIIIIIHSQTPRAEL